MINQIKVAIINMRALNMKINSIMPNIKIINLKILTMNLSILIKRFKTYKNLNKTSIQI